MNLGNVVIGRTTIKPGRSWSKCVKPLVYIDSCKAPNITIIISGRMKVRVNFRK